MQGDRLLKQLQEIRPGVLPFVLHELFGGIHTLQSPADDNKKPRR